MKKYVPIELDRMRNFRYGMEAISLVETTLDKSFGEVDFDSLKMHDMAVIIWAGLQHEDKELTPKKVMQLIDEHSSITEIMGVMSKALTVAFGEVEEGKNLAKVTQ